VRVVLADDSARGNCFQKSWTLLHISAMQGFPEFARLAIDNEADLPNQKVPIATSNYGWTVLHEAALGGCAALVELLCDAGFDVEAADLRDDTALHIAASEGAHEIVRILVRKNANVNRRNKVGRTPLHMAANPTPAWSNGDDKACAQSLLGFGAEINAIDCRERTPLYEAVLWGAETAILLLHKGDDWT
jgi:ankyrin repeat protein